MPAPTAYTEDALAQFIVDELGESAVALGLTTTAPLVVAAVHATERLLGVSDVATAADVVLVEAAARLEAWRAAQRAVAGRFSMKVGTLDLKLKEWADNIDDMVAQAQAAWYAAKQAADTAAGAGSPGFFFGVACGGRGR